MLIAALAFIVLAQTPDSAEDGRPEIPRVFVIIDSSNEMMGQSLDDAVPYEHRTVYACPISVCPDCTIPYPVGDGELEPDGRVLPVPSSAPLLEVTERRDSVWRLMLSRFITSLGLDSAFSATLTGTTTE